MKTTAKSKALSKELGGFRKSLKNENISYGELAKLGHPKYKKHLYKDVRLAEASGMSESEFRKHQK